MTPKSLVPLLAACALSLAGAGEAAAACVFQKMVEVPVTMDGLRPHVQAKINGHDVVLMVDSGAFFSVLEDDAAAKFGMKSSPAPFGLEVRGIGGASHAANAVVAQDFTFAGAQFHGIEFLVGGRVSDATAVGVIGENILGPFDVEYDLGNGMIRFFQAKGCGSANLAYWSSGMSVSQLQIDAPGRYIQQIKTTAQLNGHPIRVILDTGAPLSGLSLNAAARAGVLPSSPGVTSAGITYGLYGKGLEAFLAPFASFKIGDEEIRNTKLRMTGLALPEVDMLLGADFFLSHRILVSNSQKKIYFTYNGGPVFRLDRAGAQIAKANTTWPSGAPSKDEPKDGAEFIRRGAALMARHDFTAAIADFSRAIELEPNVAANYHDRSVARLANGQPVLAMGDLDRALKLSGADVPALMTRGELHIALQNVALGQADFDAAKKVEPENRELALRAAAAFLRAEDYPRSLQEYDVWIAAHPKDHEMAQLLGERCNVRATWGQQLDAALTDCDGALKLGEKVSTVMENRGMVLLRMGRLDEAIAQFDSAIRLQPKAAWALYGRGLAKLKKGGKVGGDADVAAAVGLRPTLPQEAKRYGLPAEERPAAPAKS